MNPRSPFAVIPWSEEFLPQLLELALEETDGDIGRASFIFPHNRPARYLTLLLHRRQGLKKPLLLPRMHTVSGLFSLICGRVLAKPAWNAGLLDRVGLLLQCAREEAGEEAGEKAGKNAGNETEQNAAFALADPKRFFPWGLRLASLFEECFSQCRRPHDFIHLEGQVSPYARALLERLGRIFSRYEAGLAEREWTTPGRDAQVAAAFLKTSGALPAGLFVQDGPVFIAGFHALTGAEDALFRHLWEGGGTIALHADPALAEGKGHWSCRALADWARAWNARLEVFERRSATDRSGRADNREEERDRLPVIRYVAGYDLHSQLAELGKELAAWPAAAGGAGPDGSPDALPDNLPDNSPDYQPDNQPDNQPDSQPGSPGGTGPVADAVPGDAGQPSDGPDATAEIIPAAAGQPALPASDRLADTAVILPDSGLLLPVLHHMPRTDVNISMGYPLARSPLFRLIDTLLRLQERRRGSGYYWRDLVELLRHPYIKMLRDEPDAGAAPATGREADAATGEAPENAPESREAGEGLRRELHVLERALRRRGGKYIEPRAFLLEEYQERESEAMPGAPVLAFLETLLATALDAFEQPRTPSRLAACLDALCGLLLDRGGHLWPRFPIDAECMYRLRHSLIPELARSALAHEPLERETLFTLLRSLMEAERVPFEADPLVGMQVMGMLESRLLSFRRVIVADAVESALPGSPQGDPLLPEPLRPELGLPSLHSREQVAAYHFFRLVKSADEVILFWREGGDAAGEAGKSRFIEELLWEEEKRRGSLFAAGRDDPPLRTVPALVSPIVRQRRALPVTPEIRRLLRAALAGPVSASLLDLYLRCPLRFFYERAASLAPADEVSEGDDPLAVGDMMHRLLFDVYKNLAGKPLPGGEALEAMLGGELIAAFAASHDLGRIGRSVPADSFAMLVTAGKKRLTEYLLAQPPATPLALEMSLKAAFSFTGSTSGPAAIHLVGKADRIDLRRSPPEEGSEAPAPHCVILDYKTGRIPRFTPGIWEREGLWNAMDAWTPDDVNANLAHDPGAADPVLLNLAESMESVQLPLYLLLHRLAAEQGTSRPEASRAGDAAGAVFDAPALDARWVALGDKGKEHALFPDAMSHAMRWEIITDKFPRLVRFLLRHIAETPILLPKSGAHCDWCSSAKLCMVSGAAAVLPRV